MELLITIGKIVRIGILTYFGYSICKLIVNYIRNKNEKR